MFNNDDEEYYEGNFNEDLERFENYLKGQHVGFIDSDVLEMIIDHYLINGQYSKALSGAEYGISNFPFNSLFIVRKAQAISAVGQLKEALELLSKAEKMQPGNCEFFLTKASIFSQLKDSKRAIKYFYEALAASQEEEKDEIYIDIAMEYENLNDYNSAINVLKEAIRFNPHNEAAIYELAHCYDQINDYNKAIDCYSDYIDENPYSFTGWYNLGNAYSKLEDWEKAIWAYEFCIVINENFSPAYFNIGNACLSLDKYKESIEHFEKCMEIDGEDGLALCYIGECYEQLGNLEMAKHYYHRAIEFIPELSEAWLGLGIVADLEGHTKEGIQLISKAIDMDAGNSSYYHVLAGAYEKLEEWDLAIESYLNCIDLDKTSEDAISDFIILLTKKELYKEALNYLETLEEVNEIRQVILLLKGCVLWSMNDFETAVLYFSTAIVEGEENAKKIFSWFPSLKNEAIILNLFSN